MAERGNQGRNVTENVLVVIDSPTVLMMERGAEGFFVVNKGPELFDIPVLDLTLTNLEGCYREHERTNGAVETNGQGQTFVTRWGTQARGGLQVQGRTRSISSASRGSTAVRNEPRRKHNSHR